MSRPLPSTETTLATGISVAMILWIAVGVVPIGAATPAASGGHAATIGPTTPPGVTTPGNETDTADTPTIPQQALVSDLQAILEADSGATGSELVAAADRALVSRQRMAADGRLPASLQSGLATERTNLQGAQALMDIIESESGADPASPTLTQAVRLTEMGMKVQVAQGRTDEQAIDPSSVTLPAVETPTHTSPSAALFALHDRHGVTPSAQAVADSRALDELPEPTRSELTDVLDAYLAYERVSEETGVDLAQVRAAQLQLVEESVDLQASFDTSKTATPWVPVVGCPGGTVQNTTAGVNIDLSATDNTYQNDYALSIDCGGDDIYKNNAGGASNGAAALVDLNGSDTYKGRNGGGATNGTGFLLDVGEAPADDTYKAGGDGSLGKGTNGGGYVRGVGFLLDARIPTTSSNTPVGDTYYAGSQGTNGGGAGRLPSNPPFPDIPDEYPDPLPNNPPDPVPNDPPQPIPPHNLSEFNPNLAGAGFHIDVGTSTDTYDAGFSGTNGGGHIGSGFLLNTAGSDTYDGIGISNDRNNSQGSNGGGFQAGNGFLLDAVGDDTYKGGRGAGNGGGNGGNGFLYDAKGSDTYTVFSSNDGVNGGAKTGGVGVLIDTGLTTDTYQAGSFGTNGGGNFGAAGFLFDAAGAGDSYTAGKYGVNGGGSTAAGLLLDSLGTGDEYNDNFCSNDYKDDTVAPKGTAGAQVDIEGEPSSGLNPIACG